MSCSSPFVVDLDGDEAVITQTSMNMQGCYTLQGYTSPGWSCCITMWCPVYPCGWHCCGGCWGGGCCCSALSWCGGYSWQYCYNVPGIELWPKLQFCGSCDLPMKVVASTGLDIGVTEPPKPYEATTVTFEACNCSCSVNGTGFTINIIPGEINLTQKNGVFSTTIDLGGFSSNTNIDGVDYDVSINSSLLLCLEPVPPVGWMNILLEIEFTATIPDTVSESCSFSLTLPLVSVEEGGA